jgi:uncharacterized membrane protein YfcA
VTTILLAVALGFAAGVLAGTFGVGGGVLFVPTLVAVGLTQIEAEATSLLAILPTVAAGAWRQRGYGNIRWQPALVIGVASVPGALLGTWLAVELGNETLRRLFALLVIAVAGQVAWRAWRQPA